MSEIPLTAGECPAVASAQLKSAKLTTRLAFFIAGFGLASWAPLVPYAKDRLGASDAHLGSILLFLGIGSVVGMPLAGALSGRLGSRFVIICGAVALILSLPFLAISTTAGQLSAALFVFGMSIGAIDVAANIHATEVQLRAQTPLMSGFHGFYSIGGLLGAAGVTLAISWGSGVGIAAIFGSLVLSVALVAALPGFLKTTKNQGDPAAFSLPHPLVMMIGMMALLTFLVEGAVLDWGAIMLHEFKGINVSDAGIGYTVFALTMTLTRLLGDGFVSKVGQLATLSWGAILTAIGVALSAYNFGATVAIIGFAIAGVGAANIVPILFTQAATQQYMSSGYAIAIVSSLGYLGVFLGPAMIGHAASSITLPMCFIIMAALMVVVAIINWCIQHSTTK